MKEQIKAYSNDVDTYVPERPRRRIIYDDPDEPAPRPRHRRIVYDDPIILYDDPDEPDEPAPAQNNPPIEVVNASPNANVQQAANGNVVVIDARDGAAQSSKGKKKGRKQKQ